jgi:hypothetical protein
MSEDTKKTAIITSGAAIAVIAAFAIGVLGNAHADTARTQMEVACVQSGGGWISDTMECRR